MEMDDLQGGCVTILVIFRDNSSHMSGVAARSNIICVIVVSSRISKFFLLMLTSRTFKLFCVVRVYNFGSSINFFIEGEFTLWCDTYI